MDTAMLSTETAASSALQVRSSPTLFGHFVLGVTPHTTQAAFLECRAPVKVAACGRRWGKSTAAALDVLHLAVVGDAEGRPTTQMVVAPTADQTTIIADQVERLLTGGPLSGLVAGVVHAPFSEITLVNGSTILARSGAYEGKYLRGRAAHRVVVDEAAFVPERTVQEAILPMLADSGGQLVLISTPFGRNHFWEHYMRGQSTDAACRSFQFPSEQNPHISAAYIAAQRETMTDLQWRAEWLAEFLDDQSTVFKWSLIERAMWGELSGPIAGHRYSCGWDPAKYRDRSAVIVLDVTDERPQSVVCCQTLDGRDYALQINRVAEIAASYNRADVLMDCTGNAALLEQMQATYDSTRVEGYTFTNATKQELIDGLVLALEQDRLMIPPTLTSLIGELRYYEYRMTAAGNVKLGAPERAGATDDLTTALALALKGGQRSSRAGVWLATVGGELGF
jgi:hypothetical protein